MKITITKEITQEMISDLIITALEGGSNYWYMIEKKITPKDWTWNTMPEIAPKHYIGDYPMNTGGGLVISTLEEDEENKTLNLKSIKQGLEIMAEKYPKHFSDMLEENTDGDTGDVFLQCCLYGDIIYG